MNLLRVRRLLSDEKAARLGAAEPSGHPHQVESCFAFVDDDSDGVVVCPLDGPVPSLAGFAARKTIERQPLVAITFGDTGLRAEAVAEVLFRHGNDPRYEMAVTMLAQRYPREPAVLPRSIIWATVTGWSAQRRDPAAA